MKRALVVGAVLMTTVATPAFAHRTDEYLQATTFLVSAHKVQAQLRLVPGVAVLSKVLDSIDTNHDAQISDSEQRAYGERVLRDLSLTLDAQLLSLQLVSWQFGTVREMKDGMGEILLNFEAQLPAGKTDRRLTFENRHRSGIAAYLVNSLVPQDSTIRITAQNRDYQQSRYELSYVQNSPGQHALSFSALLRWILWIGAALLAGVVQITSLNRKRGTRIPVA